MVGKLSIDKFTSPGKSRSSSSSAFYKSFQAKDERYGYNGGRALTSKERARTSQKHCKMQLKRIVNLNNTKERKSPTNFNKKYKRRKRRLLLSRVNRYIKSIHQ